MNLSLVGQENWGVGELANSRGMAIVVLRDAGGRLIRTCAANFGFGVQSWGEMLGCCWETFCIFAYCGLVANPPLNCFFYIFFLLPFQRQLQDMLCWEPPVPPLPPLLLLPPRPPAPSSTRPLARRGRLEVPMVLKRFQPRGSRRDVVTARRAERFGSVSAARVGWVGWVESRQVGGGSSMFLSIW